MNLPSRMSLLTGSPVSVGFRARNYFVTFRRKVSGMISRNGSGRSPLFGEDLVTVEQTAFVGHHALRTRRSAPYRRANQYRTRSRRPGSRWWQADLRWNRPTLAGSAWSVATPVADNGLPLCSSLASRPAARARRRSHAE